MKEIKLLLLALMIFSCCAVRSESTTPHIQPAESHDKAEQFNDDIFQALHLQDESIPNAINKLGRIGFQCTLTGEQKNIIYPTHPFPAAISCFLWTSKEGKIYEMIDVTLMVKGWVGDGTPLENRYTQLTASFVSKASATRIIYRDNRDSEIAKKQSKMLDEIILIATPKQPMHEVVKYSMLHDIACRTATNEPNGRSILSCTAHNAIPGCARATIDIYITDGVNPSDEFSLWSRDRLVLEKQGPWICFNAAR